MPDYYRSHIASKSSNMIECKLGKKGLIPLLWNFPRDCYLVWVFTFCPKLLSSVSVLKRLLRFTEKWLFQYWVTSAYIYIYTGGFFKILGFCFLVEDFYKPRNENIKILSVGVIWPNSNFACLPDKCILYKCTKSCVLDDGDVAYQPYILLHSQSSQMLYWHNLGNSEALWKQQCFLLVLEFLVFQIGILTCHRLL